MLLGILLAVLIVVCLALISVILLQRSEGGALGMSGGGPGAFMSARGTGDLLTRTTQILAAVFFTLCLTMTLISGHERGLSSQIEKIKGLPVVSSAPPVSSAAPGAPAGPVNPASPFGALPTTSPPPTPLVAPPVNNSLNLLGSPQPQIAVPQAPPVTPKAKVAKITPVKATPVKATPVPNGAPAAAPIVAAPPVTLPPAQPAPPTNSQ